MRNLNLFAPIMFAALFLVIIVGCKNNENNQSKTNEAKMIISSLDNAEAYYDLHPDFEKVFEFLRQPNLAEMEPGNYELDGKRVFCILLKGQGQKQADAKLEAHKKYIDIQYTISGDEVMGWNPTADNKSVAEPYDAEKDIMFFNDAPKEWNKVPPGFFTIFFPKDSHAPMVGDGEILKAVVKIQKD
jgi:biofilm protein TabA